MESLIYEGQMNNAISSLTINETEIILKQMKTSICKISGKRIGTGFFCIINKGSEKVPCLLTNYHILDYTLIKENKKILISMNDNNINEELLINEKNILYTSNMKEYDLIIIQLELKKNI